MQQSTVMGLTLNDQQQRAVTHTGSPLLIVAGPGSGKTMVIVQRILHLVKSGIDPSEILCLTFSKKAAEEMRMRLEKEQVTDVDINTFHSFAKSLLEDTALESGINISSGIIKRPSQLVWGLKNIDTFGLKHVVIGNNAEDLIRSIIDGIRTFKDELISPDVLGKYLDSKRSSDLSDQDEKDFVDRLEDLHKVYVCYQEFWNGKNVIDFNDMIVEAVNLLQRHGAVGEKIRQKYRHILVDEFQDNNYAQLELVKTISKDGNVTAVGDDDQCIYRFQGAYLRNFLDFQDSFSNVTTINLDQNYRSTQNIVNLASDLLKDIPQRQQKKLFSNNTKGQKIGVIQCSDESSEAEFVIKTIRDLVGENKQVIGRDGSPRTISYRDIAILSRNRISGAKFAGALRAHGIAADFVGAQNMFGSPAVRDIMAYLAVASRPANSGRELTRLMQKHGINPYNIAKINKHAARISNSDSPDLDYVLMSLQEFAKREKHSPQKWIIKEFVTELSEVTKLSRLRPGDAVYRIIMDISGLYRDAVKTDTAENRQNQTLLNEIYNASLEYDLLYPDGELDDLTSYLDYLFRFEPDSPEEADLEDAVTVTTIHQSKGRQFQAVFIVDVVKDKLPLRFRSKKFYVPKDLAKGLVREDDEKKLHILDEKRLFYVAMTRAKSHLYVTYAKSYENRSTDAKPSQFLTDLNFMESPLIDFSSFTGNDGPVSLEPVDDLDRLKRQYQQFGIDCIGRMNLKSAVGKILDLAKIKYFEENNNSLDGFDAAQILQMRDDGENENENENENDDGDDDNGDIDGDYLESLLSGKKRPLIKKEDFGLSPSKLQTYEDCPLRFKFQHVLKTPTPPKTYFLIGSAIHSVAERLTKMQKEGSEISADIAMDILRKHWDASAYRNNRTKETQDKESSSEMVKTYLDWMQKNPNTPVETELKFDFIFHGVKISGKIDRVDQTSDGDYVVTDFKTGKSSKPKKSVREDIQLNVYALGIKKIYEKLPKQASLYYLKNNKILTYEIEPSTLQTFEKKLSETVQAIFDEEFPPKPDFQKCKRCDFANICDEKKTSY